MFFGSPPPIVEVTLVRTGPASNTDIHEHQEGAVFVQALADTIDRFIEPAELLRQRSSCPLSAKQVPEELPQREDERNRLRWRKLLDASHLHNSVQTLPHLFGWGVSQQCVEERGKLLGDRVPDRIGEAIALFPEESPRTLWIERQRGVDPLFYQGITMFLDWTGQFLASFRQGDATPGIRWVAVFSTNAGLPGWARSRHTQPVGLGRPATLHAPFAGPEGNRS